jgi:hypothetical protein
VPLPDHPWKRPRSAIRFETKSSAEQANCRAFDKPLEKESALEEHSPFEEAERNEKIYKGPLNAQKRVLQKTSIPWAQAFPKGLLRSGLRQLNMAENVLYS